MKNEIVQKYNIPVPRYTSFPAVPYWTGAPSELDWVHQLNSNYDPEQGLELYIHIPFCQKLCFYCGCHRTITKNKQRGMEYVDYLLKEWHLYLYKMKTIKEIKISSLHLGGGTPNFLSPQAMEKLFKELSENFDEENFIGSIEIDPRTCEYEQLEVLKKYGFQRISMGIQDFDLEVQKAIGRIQPYEKVKKVCDQARSLGFEDLNFDLIYGLPYQTPETIKKTISQVLTLAPYQIAFYSYAHLPQKLKNQKLIQEEALPQGASKRFLYDLGKSLLSDAHYMEIGLDHFAKEASFLGQAKKQGRLRRNFMGHTFKVSPIIIGLGVSAISSSTKSFAQNAKDLKTYFHKLDIGTLPITHGHTHSKTDQQIESLMQNFFANEYLEKNQWQGLPHLEMIERKIAELIEDDLVEMANDKLQVTELGKPFMRVIASTFDYYYQQSCQNKIGSKAL